MWKSTGNRLDYVELVDDRGVPYFEPILTFNFVEDPNEKIYKVKKEIWDDLIDRFVIVPYTCKMFFNYLNNLNSFS